MSGLWNGSTLTIFAIQIRQDIVNATMVSRALVPSTPIPGRLIFSSMTVNISLLRFPLPIKLLTSAHIPLLLKAKVIEDILVWH
jgi:hypothetical protein